VLVVEGLGSVVVVAHVNILARGVGGPEFTPSISRKVD